MKTKTKHAEQSAIKIAKYTKVGKIAPKMEQRTGNVRNVWVICKISRAMIKTSGLHV